MTDLLRFRCQSIELQAATEPDQDDTKGIRCTLAAYNGGSMNIAGHGEVVVDTSGVKAAAQTPLLSGHDASLGGVVGFATVNASGGKLTAAGYVVPSTDAAKQIVSLAKAGFAFQASIGLEPTEKENLKPDQLVNVNGQQIRAGSRGLTLVRAGNLKEISILPLGADSSTSVKISATSPKGHSMSTSVNNPEEIIRAERERVRSIEAACAGFGDDPAAQQLRAKAIAGDLDLSQLNAGLLTVLRGKRVVSQAVGNPTMYATRPDGKDVLSAAILIRAGQEPAGVKGFGAETMQRARDLRLTSFVDILRAAWVMDGREPPKNTNELIQASSGASIVSLPNILSNAMHKTLMNSYQSFPSAMRQIAKKLVAEDFKTHRDMRLTGDIIMKTLPVSGEIEPARLGEQAYTWNVGTYARIIKIDRTLIVNDDLSAFGTVPQMFGRGAALAQEDKFWSMVLANSDSFFAGANANYLSGTTAGPTNSAISLEGMQNAVATMLRQVDDAGYPVNIVPRFLVVPPELKSAGDSLFHSLTVVAGPTAAAGAALLPSANAFFGLAEPLVSPYLSNSNYSGYSLTGWYLFGDPGDVAAFGIGYLNGTEVPFVEQVPNAPETLGWCFRAYTDFGVTQLDPRGAVFCAGA
jgi:hypothetical protein